MLKRIDLWVGRHMSWLKWAVVWSAVHSIGWMLVITQGLWGAVFGMPLILVSLLGVCGNMRRWRR